MKSRSGTKRLRWLRGGEGVERRGEVVEREVVERGLRGEVHLQLLLRSLVMRGIDEGVDVVHTLVMVMVMVMMVMVVVVVMVVMVVM